MAGLIEEIQRDALNQAVPVSNLLRKVKIAASKLRLEQVERWVEHELNGYLDGPVPDYRMLEGRPQAFNPLHGWIPIVMASDEEQDALSLFAVRETAASLEATMAASETNYLEVPYPPQLIRELSSSMRVNFGRMSNLIPLSRARSLLDHVRNMVLDWALALERRGIVGEGLSFNDTERKEAQQVMNNFHIGQIGQLTGNVGSGNTTGTISSSGVTITQATDISNKLRARLPELEKEGVDTDQLGKVIDAIDAEVALPSPNPSKLQELLTDARSILTGAAGSMLAEGALALINHVLG